ncbi:MAG: hypothetical protein GY925_18180 [Actinomycetia bacterium]|nr:hypothetical protein [Actinomycetes bacterium]
MTEFPSTRLRGGRSTAFSRLAVGAGWIIVVAIVAVLISPAQAADPWSDDDRTHRLEFSITPNGVDRVDHEAVVEVDFTDALSALGDAGATLVADSIRVYEVSATGAVVGSNDDVIYQFDEGPNFDAAANAVGDLTVLLTGTTSSTRHYHAYFRTSASPGSYTPSDHSGLDRVRILQNRSDDGRSTHRIDTAQASWWYDKLGGGFSSIHVGGEDWINWSTAAGSAGEFRGLPNLEYPTTIFHPGHNVVSTIVDDVGPLRVRLSSTSNDGKWKVRWTFYHQHTEMEVLKTPAGADYWFLYEGTPGGSLDAGDKVIRSNGSSIGALSRFSGDISSPEWVAVADPADNAAVWIANLDDDSAVDSYRAMNGEMTVLGLGRKTTVQTMSGLRTFAVGLVPQSTFGAISTLVDRAIEPLTVTMGSPSARVTTSTTVTTNTSTSSTTSTSTSPATSTTIPDTPEGYLVVTSAGTVHPFGALVNMGNANTTSAVAVSLHTSGAGYWILDEDGMIHAFGESVHHGDLGGTVLEVGEKAAAMAVMPDGGGYWIVTSKGRVAAFGTAEPHGDLLSIALAGDIIDAAPTPSGLGYYLVGADGGIFAFGDAEFVGSVPQVLPGVTLDQPVVGITPDPDGTGYWLVGGDGGVFAFGDAPFVGSLPGLGLTPVAPINGMVPYGDGYLLVASDGGVFNFSNLEFFGSLGGVDLTHPITAIAAV